MSLVETLTDPANLITAAVAVASFATLMTLAAPALRGDKLDARMKSVATRREELRRRSRAAIQGGQPQASTLRRTDEGAIKKIVDQLQLTRLLEDPRVADKLATGRLPRPAPDHHLLLLPLHHALRAGAAGGDLFLRFERVFICRRSPSCAWSWPPSSPVITHRTCLWRTGAEEATRVDHGGLPRCAGPAPDLCRSRHVDRSGDPEGGGRNRGRFDRGWPRS